MWWSEEIWKWIKRTVKQCTETKGFIIWLWLLQISLFCNSEYDFWLGLTADGLRNKKQTKQNDIIAWITCPRSAEDTNTSLWQGGDDESSCSSVLTSSHFQWLLTSNDRVSANKMVSYFHQECASVCLPSLFSLTTFNCLSFCLKSALHTLPTHMSSWLN